ncbi:tetratricopeptide repeat protein [Ferribacterium limneticum]|uniref:tetratricopeptide repeat protein n=1 Tax=Ferribacterium limneticum TaxID=76259 RepID=UPI001CF9A563|nr:tetratricopeptide repeat protein [Ferribacterium limneticum]UCV27955.1 sel1 repeat family protein [Ferribacterium limneticum]UCV31872.1 sel1 repeat family protein [Ferribacterium limneticum]
MVWVLYNISHVTEFNCREQLRIWVNTVMHRKRLSVAVAALVLLIAGALADDGVSNLEELRKLPIANLEELASRGESNAKLVLGYEFFLGERVTIDRQRALALYVEASELGSGMAMSNICNMYHYGYGVDQDDAIAYRWCEKAVKLGNPNAMIMIAEMLQAPEGLAKDKPRESRSKIAFGFYKLAAKQGHKVGQYMQGLYLEQGIGTEKDLEAALLAYEASAKQDYEPAVSALYRLSQ